MLSKRLRVALPIALLLSLASCGARTPLESTALTNSSSNASIESSAAPLAPTALDLAAPAKFETATFALG